MLIYDGLSEKLRDSTELQFVDKVFELKAKGKLWEVIGLIVKQWQETNPVNYKSFLIDVKTKRETRATKYGSNKSMNLRSVVDVPQDVIYRIRTVYSPDELPMDLAFFKQMYKRYPQWAVAERI